jgi:hypothetical protein
VTEPDGDGSQPAPKKVEGSVHRCERCHLYFRVDHNVDRGYMVKRWLCPPCYEYLLDRGRVDERTALEGAPWSSRN